MTEMVSGVAMGLVTDSATNQVFLFLKCVFIFGCLFLLEMIMNYDYVQKLDIRFKR